MVDIGKYLPHSVSNSNYGNCDDQEEVDLYNRLLPELDKSKQRALLRQLEKHVLDDQARAILLLRWYRIVPHHSYIKGWKISPSHHVNQDPGTVWLNK